LLQLVEDKVWQWTVPSDALPAIKAEQLVSSTIRRDTGVQVRVVSDDSPAAEAVRVTPNLEDVYLHQIEKAGEPA
jgi:hypothetical protein